tara:strand:- start:212 stop:550 length:339 start_codon:yes stop_codon:yes gene_type:complete
MQNWRLTLHAVNNFPSQNKTTINLEQNLLMSRHNVRVRVRMKPPHGLIRNVRKHASGDKAHKVNMFTKVVMEKQALRERYIELMNDAERAVGRKEAIYLLRDADIIWQKINT